MESLTVTGPLRNLRDLISRLRAVLGVVDLNDLMAFVRAVADLVDLPDPDDEALVRDWVRDAIGTAGLAAVWTPTEYDDRAVGFLGGVVDSDAAWGLMYPMIRRALAALPQEEMPTATAAEELPGIDPATIILIVTTVIELIKMIREMRGK